MRIAVLISGEYRTFGMCRKTMKLLDDPRVDIYFSTWSKTAYNVPKVNLHRVEEVTEEIIRRDLGKAAVIEIESKVPFVEMRYNSRMIHRWKRGMDLIRKSGIDYDYILIMRPDLYFGDHADNEFKTIEHFKYVLGCGWYNNEDAEFLNDVMLLSTAKKMFEMFDALSIWEWQTSPNDDWHTWWYSFASRFFPMVKPLEHIARCTFCRPWVKEGDLYLEVAQIQADWSDLIVLQFADRDGIETVSKYWPEDVIVRMQQKWTDKVYDKYMEPNEGDNI